MDTLLELIENCNTCTYEATEQDTQKLEKARELRELGFKGIADQYEFELLMKIKLKRIADERYIEITEDNIHAFLKRKVEKYNKDHQKPEKKKEENHLFMGGSFIDAIRSANLFGGRDYLNQLQLLQAQQQVFQQNYGNTGSIASYDPFSAPIYIAPLGSGIGLNPFRYKETITEKTCDYYKTEGIGRYEWKEESTESYKTIPPKDVLERLRQEKEKNIFDYFTIASVNAVRDPILIGRVDKHRFFICQWGDDVTLDDLI